MNADYFYRFTEELQKYISSQLPGFSAHQQMTPEGRSMQYDPLLPPRKSAVLLLLYPQNNQVFIPVIKRPEYDGIHSGQMALPGGKFEELDGDLIQTALRECCEEIGICSPPIEIIGPLSEIFISITNMLVLPVVGRMNEVPNFIIDPVEVAGLYPITITDLLNPEFKKKECWNIRGTEVDVPYYLLNNQKVWGATAMILSELEYLLRLMGFKG